MSLIGGLRRQPPAAPLPVSWGDLDNAPPPRRPDVTVFGGWRPAGPIPQYVQHACKCGCCQAVTGPCWQCDAMVTAGQWL
jgi:hypothetical protein